MNRARTVNATLPVGLGRLSGDAGAVALGQISAFAYPIVSIPFLSRTLGNTGLGRLIFAMAIIQLVIYVVDFGFGMSALRAVSVARTASDRGRVVGATLGAKVLLLAACTLVLVPTVFLIPTLHDHWLLYIVGLLAMVGQVAFPSWLLQGLGRMKTFALITAVSRLIALGGLLLTVRSDTDTSWAMLWQFAPVSIAAAICWVHLHRIGLGQLQFPTLSEIRSTLRDSSPLFISTMATMVVGAANAVILGTVSTLHQVAFFGTAERMSNAARGILSGVQEAMLPRMIAAEVDEHGVAVRRTIMVAMAAFSMLAGVAIIVTARWFIPWYLGPGFDGAVPVARILAVALCLTGFTTVFTLVLVARNEYRTVSMVMAVGAIIHLALLPFGAIVYGAVGAALAVVATEICLASMMAMAYRRSQIRSLTNTTDVCALQPQNGVPDDRHSSNAREGL